MDSIPGEIQDKLPLGLQGSIMQTASVQTQALAQLLQRGGGQGDDAGLFQELGSTSGSSSSVRGAAGRDRLQALLRERPGVLSSRIREATTRRMGSSGATSGSFDMLRYLERYSGYGQRREFLHLQKFCFVLHFWQKFYFLKK